MHSLCVWVIALIGAVPGRVVSHRERCSSRQYHSHRQAVTLGKNCSMSCILAQTQDVYWYRHTNRTVPWIHIRFFSETRVTVSYADPHSSWRVEGIAYRFDEGIFFIFTVIATDMVNATDLGLYFYGDKKGIVGCYDLFLSSPSPITPTGLPVSRKPAQTRPRRTTSVTNETVTEQTFPAPTTTVFTIGQTYVAPATVLTVVDRTDPTAAISVIVLALVLGFVAVVAAYKCRRSDRWTRIRRGLRSRSEHRAVPTESF